MQSNATRIERLAKGRRQHRWRIGRRHRWRDFQRRVVRGSGLGCDCGWGHAQQRRRWGYRRHRADGHHGRHQEHDCEEFAALGSALCSCDLTGPSSRAAMKSTGREATVRERLLMARIKLAAPALSLSVMLGSFRATRSRARGPALDPKRPANALISIPESCRRQAQCLRVSVRELTDCRRRRPLDFR